MCGTTCRAYCRRIFLITAIMTMQFTAAFMVGEAYITVNAFWCVGAYFTHHYRGVATAVLEQDHLLFIFQSLPYISYQYTGKMRLDGFGLSFFGYAYNIH